MRLVLILLGLCLGCRAMKPPAGAPSALAIPPGRPEVAFQPPPRPYPPEAKAKGREGTATVGLVIGEDGSIQKILPIKGDEPFLATTLAYARGWRFKPHHPAPESNPVVLTVGYHLVEGRAVIDITWQ